ncbi:MAG TPA: CheR family methyltransferase [Bryobacteraceae bacterium]
MRAAAVASELASKVNLARLSELIAEKIGLHFPPERQSDLRRRLADLTREFDFPDTGACIDWLLAEPLTKTQLQALASHLTVGETYFFRDSRTFEVLADSVLPELIRNRRNGGRYLRLWSAACCTGEEPYSLAILLHRLIPDLNDWRITILATDINQKFLRKAAEGIYGDWSFRQSPPWLRDLYFRSAGRGRYEIAPAIRKLVTFREANLVDDCPATATGCCAMDVILCRNVLMYFTTSQAARAVDTLHDALIEGGWLAVSPCEASQTLFARFRPAGFSDAVLYRKTGSETRAAMPETTPAGWSEALSFEPAPFTATEMLQDEAPRLPVLPADAQSFSSSARALADQGDLPGALLCCDRWIGCDKLNASAHYLRAAILQERGDHLQARVSLLRAIYLRPDWPLAHFASGNTARALGDSKEADKHFTNASRLLTSYESDHVLTDSDGLTAARLTEIISSLTTPKGKP